MFFFVDMLCSRLLGILITFNHWKFEKKKRMSFHDVLNFKFGFGLLYECQLHYQVFISYYHMQELDLFVVPCAFIAPSFCYLYSNLFLWVMDFYWMLLVLPCASKLMCFSSIWISIDAGCRAAQAPTSSTLCPQSSS